MVGVAVASVSVAGFVVESHAQLLVFRDRVLWEAALAGHVVQRNMFAGVGQSYITSPVRVDFNTTLHATSYHGLINSVSSFGLSSINDSPFFEAGLVFDTPIYAFGANIGASSTSNPVVQTTLSGPGLSTQTFSIIPPGGFWGFINPSWQVRQFGVSVNGQYNSGSPFSWGFGNAVYAIVPAPGSIALVGGVVLCASGRRRRREVSA